MNLTLRILPVLLGGLVIAGLSGCAAPQTERILSSAIARPASAEIANVPFFPQEQFYCGPASLAMVLSWSGSPITPGDVTGEVYTPGREGTFAPDIVAAARRHGRLAVDVRDLATLLAALDAGYPVIVMQNLGLSWYPRWHFAVAVGYDLSGPRLILRSGTERRRVTALDAFERTWQRAGYWALVVLPPDTAPSFADESSWLSAIAGLERTDRAEESLTAYRTFLSRYPGHRIARMGEANVFLAVKDYRSAEQGYRRVLELDPRMAEAWNNLAYALHFQGRHADAVGAAQRALAIAGGEDENYADTLREVSAAAR